MCVWIDLFVLPERNIGNKNEQQLLQSRKISACCVICIHCKCFMSICTLQSMGESSMDFFFLRLVLLSFLPFDLCCAFCVCKPCFLSLAHSLSGLCIGYIQIHSYKLLCEVLSNANMHSKFFFLLLLLSRPLNCWCMLLFSFTHTHTHTHSPLFLSFQRFGDNLPRIEFMEIFLPFKMD